MALLKVENGPEQGREILLTGENMDIGRHSSNPIVVVDPKVSRHQCSVFAKDGTFYVKDADSRNGTRVNGQKVHITPLKHGDKINIGLTTLVFIYPVEATEEMVPPPAPRPAPPKVAPPPKPVAPVRAPAPVSPPPPVEAPYQADEAEEEIPQVELVESPAPPVEIEPLPVVKPEAPTKQHKTIKPPEEFSPPLEIISAPQPEVPEPEPVALFSEVESIDSEPPSAVVVEEISAPQPVEPPAPKKPLTPVPPPAPVVTPKIPEPVIESPAEQFAAKPTVFAPRMEEPPADIPAPPPIKTVPKPVGMPPLKPPTPPITTPSGVEIFSPPPLDEDVPPAQEISRPKPPSRPATAVEIIAPPPLEEPVEPPPAPKPVQAKIPAPPIKAPTPVRESAPKPIDEPEIIAPTVMKPPAPPAPKAPPAKIPAPPVPPPAPLKPKVVKPPAPSKDLKNVPEKSSTLDAEDEKINLRNYQIIELLGNEKFGKVYKARQTSMDRVVALKILSKEFIRDKNMVNHFIDEARVCGKLNHPHILQIHDVGEKDGIYFLSREYVDGPGLSEYLQTNAPLAVDLAAEYFTQLVRAVDFIHQNRQSHGDIKPLNVRLTSDDQIKLLTVGMSKSYQQVGEHESGKEEAYGAWNYRAPEALGGSEPDMASDIYSLGAVFYHMLTGEMPYKSARGYQDVRDAIAEPLSPVKEINPRCPEQAARIVEKMMAKKPSNRYSGTHEILDALTKLEEGETGGALESKPEPSRKPSIHAPASVSEPDEIEAPKTSIIKWILLGLGGLIGLALLVWFLSFGIF